MIIIKYQNDKEILMKAFLIQIIKSISNTYTTCNKNNNYTIPDWIK